MEAAFCLLEPLAVPRPTALCPVCPSLCLQEPCSSAPGCSGVNSSHQPQQCLVGKTFQSGLSSIILLWGVFTSFPQSSGAQNANITWGHQPPNLLFHRWVNQGPRGEVTQLKAGPGRAPSGPPCP